MADNDQYNEEYQFADLDEVTPASESESEVIGMEPEPASQEKQTPRIDFTSPNVKRNAAIVIGAFVLIIGLYKIIGTVFTGKKTPSTVPTPTLPSMQAATPTPSPTPIQSEMPPATTPSPQSTTANTEDSVSSKLSELETSQQTIRSDVSSVSTQLGSISDNLNTMTQKMVELNNVIASLSAKLEIQSHEIEQLTAKKAAKNRSHYVARQHRSRPIRYYIQAVIPGRAWLIGTNGSTLTVREGTIISGYGVVKLIDPNQGKVLTSSGHVIKFSQEDS